MIISPICFNKEKSKKTRSVLSGNKAQMSVAGYINASGQAILSFIFIDAKKKQLKFRIDKKMRFQKTHNNIMN